MKISFATSHERFKFPFRIIGHAGRYDTISDCEFLADDVLVTCDRQMARLYIVKFDLEAGTHTVSESKEIVVNGQPQHFELLYFDPVLQTLYSVSYRNSLFSARIHENRVVSYDTAVVTKNEAYHGVARSTVSTLYVTNMLNNTITEYNPKTYEKRSITCEGGVRMKDVAVMNDDVLLAISSDDGPAIGIKYPGVTLRSFHPPYDSHAFVYKRDNGELVSRYVFPKTQIDAVVYHEPFCFVTCADGVTGQGYLMRFTMDESYNFTNPTKIPCAGFPHGIAVRNDVLAYTSYTDSALYVHRLTDLHSFDAGP